jgi:alkylhydroperoxidase family enzyme
MARLYAARQFPPRESPCRACDGIVAAMFTIHTQETAPEGSREALGAIHERLGFVPNLAATIAESPTALACFGALQGTLRGSEIAAVEREVAGLVTSFDNESRYSMAAHSTFATGAGMPPESVSALRAGQALGDERLEAVRAFAASVVRERGHARESYGLSAAEQLEVVAQIAYTTFANLVANLADTRLDDAFAAQAWESPATLGASG